MAKLSAGVIIARGDESTPARVLHVVVARNEEDAKREALRHMRSHSIHERNDWGGTTQSLDMVTAQVVTDGSTELENAILRQRLNEAHAALKRVWELTEHLKGLGPNENEQDPYDLGQELQEVVGEGVYQQMMHAPRPDEVSILPLLEAAQREHEEAMRSQVGVVTGTNQFRIERARGVVMGILRVKAACDGVTLHTCPICSSEVQVSRRRAEESLPNGNVPITGEGSCGHRFPVEFLTKPSDE